MDNIAKFENFLDSLKGSGQDNLIESVKKGFNVCFENQNDVVKQRAFAFNTLVKKGVILEILNAHVKNFSDNIKTMDELIDNAMQEIQEEISKMGAYSEDDMSYPELERLEDFITMRIKKQYGNLLQ